MAESYEVVVIGGGHNGLTTAAYLAKAGLSVCVVERQHNIGGGCSTEEVTLPGFKHNLHSQGHMGGPVYTTQELEKHGATYVRPDPQYACVFRDDRSVILYQDLERTIDTIATFSKRDAEAYRRMFQKFRDLRRIIIASWFAPPMPPSNLYRLFENTADGQELLFLLNSSCKSVVDHYFESQQVKVWVLLAAMQGSIPLDVYGLGINIPTLFTGLHLRPYGVCVGGARNFAEALANVLRQHGGVIKKSAAVARVLVEGGEARGVELADGTRILATRAIASNTSIKPLMLELVGRERLPEEFARQVDGYLPEEMTLFTPHYALDGPVSYRAARLNPDVDQAMYVSWGVETVAELQTQINDIRIGRASRVVGAFSLSPSKHDPSQAPAGKHTGMIWQFAPFRLHGAGENWVRAGLGEWGEGGKVPKEAYADYLTERYREVAPDSFAPRNILGRHVYSPWDIVQNNPAMFEASTHHGRCTANQMGIFRPFPGWANYRMPIKKLYLCGGSAHPLGGVHGGPGFNCAGAIADDLGVKKWWLRESKTLRAAAR
ncbi:MAG: NAD(P)/FAD-dependent oxidoreductase [Candidatus Tectomicrobia bacterium]|nr:NAD(P)/FAD-dependent oxidoreductase [Candidatus Tectomicrobia bacterium]